MLRTPCVLLLILSAIALWPSVALADSGLMRGPHAGSARRPPLGTTSVPDYLSIVRRPAEATGTAPFTSMLNFYRTVISPVDGNRCEMAPTCSLYAQQAFKEHGVVMGFLLTADRLLHEADEQPRVRTYTLAGAKHYVDPISANTYWLPRWMR